MMCLEVYIAAADAAVLYLGVVDPSSLSSGNVGSVEVQKQV